VIHLHIRICQVGTAVISSLYPSGQFNFKATIVFPGLQQSPVKQFRLGLITYMPAYVPSIAGDDFQNVFAAVNLACQVINGQMSFNSIISPGARLGRDQLVMLPMHIAHDNGTGLIGAMAAYKIIFADNINDILPMTIIGTPYNGLLLLVRHLFHCVCLAVVAWKRPVCLVPLAVLVCLPCCLDLFERSLRKW
jgi:hypothetical protein